ncbi:transcriptional regulator [Pyrobaculum aerophilum]|uniref:transcriptional regulator n=1 Tax=Pyrobaculum aerophilum TaxID=13773 RepID=UPI0023F047A6|nr:transcriptional regulator [Pyrobaculum aerophilum]MCX8137659.1 transcriptional regulator [Pyrobaculum aerophilum]
MSRDRAVGVGLMAVSIIVILAYAWLVFFSPYAFLVLQLTAFIAVAGVLGILAWVGYALATTPPPKPIEEIEKEIEAELKRLEEEAKGQSPGQ